MKKPLIIGVGAVVLTLGAATLWMNYTHGGRVTGMYLFSAFKAPLSVKTACIRDASARVDEKFTLPLAFDEDSKNGLREFWHFSYYRACLMRNGYDFMGNTIPPSLVQTTDARTEYVNHFGAVTMTVPENTAILEDNVVDPDTEDRRVASTLAIGSSTVSVIVYRNYDDAKTLTDLAANASYFDASEDPFTTSTTFTNGTGVELIAAADGNNRYGFMTMLPSGKVLQVFGDIASREVIDALAASLVLGAK